MSVGYNAVGVVRKDKTLWMWGTNATGEVGDGTSVSKTSPVTVSGGKQWIQVSVGETHVVALDANNNIWSWGSNFYGQLGDGTSTNRTTPVSLSSGGIWKTAVAGSGMTAAIDLDDILWTWGYNSVYGSLGDGTTSNRTSPVTVVGGKRWKSVSVGVGLFNTVLATDTNSKVWGWGYNSGGQVGNGTTGAGGVGISSPVSLIGVGNSLYWDQVCTNGSVSGAIATDGTLWMWGFNTSGILGDNTSSLRALSPVTTAGGGTNWKQLFFSNETAYGLKTDGTLWSWGSNRNGTLGIDSFLPSSVSSPVMVNRINPGYNPGAGWKMIPTNGGRSQTGITIIISEGQGY